MKLSATWLSLLLFLAGLTSSLAFAPFNHFWLVFLLFPALFYTCFNTNLKQAAKYAFSFSLGWFLSGIGWVFVSLDNFGGMPFIVSAAMILALAAYLAIYFTAAISLSHYLQKFSQYAIYTLPAFWCLFEWLRSLVLTGFPWLSIGYSQLNSPLSVMVPYVGEIGLTFSIILISVISAKHYSKLQIILPMLVSIVLISALLPNQTATTSDKNSVKLTLVQGNILQENRWDPEFLWPVMEAYQDLSRPYYGDSDIIIWPEAAIPAVEPIAQDYLLNLDKATGYNNTALITGIINYQQYSNEFFNSLIVLGNQNYRSGKGHYQYGHDNRYNKHHLLPIGEFIPFEQWLRGISPLFDLPFSSFNRGEYIQADLKANGFNVMAAICYEIVFPQQIKANLKPDTDFILTVSNDAWFGESHGPHQHLEIAQMRALEFGIPVVRVTNTGITAIIDELGQIQAQSPQFEEHILQHRLTLNRVDTLYLKLGNLPIIIISALMLLAIFIHAIREKHMLKITTERLKVDNGNI
ncbi:apolipoprotein N-acyltransferase [Catenovulum maritimum]|uniref:Apolipoprotein N-acyltransferase n=1 Tax=Catenovulum maritimum TaxID=1513271 RepID=A0A0J8JM08_9ALTE|nr:apolipoprotein N-acyltransferase [Catenovulum maritimum]KMT65606.1 acyltransferase [Catenovulum maritimum]